MRQGHRDAEGPATGEPPRGRQGPGCRPRAAKGGSTRHRNGIRCRHEARGTGTSGGCGRRLGGWLFALGEEVGSGFKREGSKEERLRMGRL